MNYFGIGLFTILTTLSLLKRRKKQKEIKINLKKCSNGHEKLVNHSKEFNKKVILSFLYFLLFFLLYLSSFNLFLYF